MINYYHSCAYRFDDGQVEGFRGYCHDPMFKSPKACKELAKQDAFEQIRRKLEFIRISRPNQSKFDESKVINYSQPLTEDEYTQVKRDWNTNLRY
jgi:hypothetical protein